MAPNKYMQETDNNLVHTYNRFPVTLERGEGVYIYDTDGKKYLDFAAWIAVSGLGYWNQELNLALKEQIDKLMHSSNLYYNTTCGEAANALKKISGMDRVFFTNSGAEAIEGAIKAAKKYAYTRDGHAGHEIIAMNQSFHGRTIGALSVTGNEHYRESFEPLMPGVKYADYNNLGSVKAAFTERTCAVIMETVQGEGGIYPAKQEFLEGVRSLCDEHGALLILDEIQCGMGRTGRMFAYGHYGILPDIMTSAKALGNGVPVGAFAAVKKFAEAMRPGDHGTTYGGNPLAAAAVCKVFEIFKEKEIPGHVQEMSFYFFEKLLLLLFFRVLVFLQFFLLPVGLQQNDTADILHCPVCQCTAG